MRIHKTQNLISLSQINSTNIHGTNEIRTASLKDEPKRLDMAETCSATQNVSFGKKNPAKGFSLLDKAAKKIKKSFAERVANTKIFKKISNSDSFGKFLEFVNKQEVMIQAGTSLIICTLLRPLAILALPGDKNKEDCKYAASHSFSSGVWGFIVPFLCIMPLANGYNYAKDNIHLYAKNLEKIKERLPHVDINTLKGANGKIKPLKEGADICGNKIITNMNEVQKIPLPKHIQTEASEATLKELMPTIDIALSKKTGSWVDKSGKELLPQIEDLFFAAEKINAKGEVEHHFFPYLTADENVLKDVFKGLDLASIKDANGNRIHPTQWKFNNDFKIEKKHLFSSNWNDTENACIPLTTGFREDGSKQCYLNNSNGKKGALGTPVTIKMSEADKVNTVLDKIGGWMPDIVVAYPRATATIAIIPFVLKNVFGMEKSKKQPTLSVADRKEVK